MRLALFLIAVAIFSVSLVACAKPTPPEGVEPVTDFEAERYMGKWYEIARLDHKFERGLSHVTAEYSLKDDGSIKVINRGWDIEDEEWDEATGHAEFIGEESVGALEVTFFWPFSGGYFIMALDKEEYQWAMVAGPNKDYLWLLSREPTMREDVFAGLTNIADDAGFDTTELIVVKQVPPISQE